MLQRPEMLLSTSTSSLKLYKVTLRSTSHGKRHIDVFFRVLVAVLYTSGMAEPQWKYVLLGPDFQLCHHGLVLNVRLSVVAFQSTLACPCFVRGEDRRDVHARLEASEAACLNSNGILAA